MPAVTDTALADACTITLPLPSFNAVASTFNPVKVEPSPLNDVAVTTPVTSIPCEFAVTAEPTTI